MNAGLDGRPEIGYDWSTVESYLDRLDEVRPSLNLAYLVGTSALRIGAVGWEEAAATPAQVANMRGMLREAMEQGAIGLSSGLDYPPGSFADLSATRPTSGAASSASARICARMSSPPGSSPWSAVSAT